MAPNTKVFNSEERTKFFESSGLPFWDAFYEKANKEKIYYPYMLYTCKKEPLKKIREIEKASILVAKVFDKVASEVKEWNKETMLKWGFKPEYFDLLELEWDQFFCFRAGWAFKGKQLKLMEINSQTPSCWFEPETGNKLLIKQFKLKDPNPKSNDYLRSSINQAIEKGLQKRDRYYQETPLVGFVTCNWYEDLHIMRWLSKFCNYNYEVLHIEELDFSKDGNIPFSRTSQRAFDALIFWHPIEYMPELKFKNGDKVWDVFVGALKQNSFSLVHALPSFFIQSKAILAYITKNKKRLFKGELKEAEKYFADTYLEEGKFKDNFIAKPLWGREGRGSYINNKGKITYSRYQENYYSKQQKVYQELLTLPIAKINELTLNIIYEAWVYRVDGKFTPGSIGTRGSQHLITDDFSYWLPIGV